MPVCEICKLSLRDGEGYILSTRQVVTAPAFWEQRFTNVVLGFKRKFSGDLPRVESDKKFKFSLLTECRKQTGWLICDGCISQFPGIDREKSRKCAAEFWKSEDKKNYSPPENEPISAFEAAKIAGPVWKRMVGFDPPEIEPDKSSRKKKKGCFIATACFGNENCSEVLILRKFRDEKLLSNKLGSLFVYIYYLCSPPISDFIRNKPAIMKTIKRFFLDPIVSILR